MPQKVSDRIKALQQQRAAALTPSVSTPGDERAPDLGDVVATVHAHFGGSIEQVVHNRIVQRLLVGLIAPDLRPEMRQPRLLPRPDELMQNGQPTSNYRELAAELLALGQSLKERQVQPIVVYPGSSAIYPAARYLILVGQRRWTAAHLVGLEAIDAVVIDPPTPADRIRLQYAENEDREEFSDMERAWSIMQMKQALDDAPWEEVEARLQISRTRRHQLTRMLAFTAAQQERLALLRLQETQARSLHTAVRNNELTAAQVDDVLARLSEIATERAAVQAQDARIEQARAGIATRRNGIDGPTVARLVVRALRATPERQPESSPRWLPPLRDLLVRTTKGVQRSQERLPTLADTDAGVLLDDIERLAAELNRAADVLRQRRDTVEP